MARLSFRTGRPRQLRARSLAVALACLLTAPAVPGAATVVATGNAALHLGKTVGSARLSPTIGLTLSVDRDSAIPGDRLHYTAVVTNTGANLTIQGDLTAQNTDATQATIADYYDVVSTSTLAHCGVDLVDSGQDVKHWPPLAGLTAAQAGYVPVLAAPMASGLRLSATPVASSGVAYPGTGDRILGTTIDPGATATWHYSATIPLSLTQVSYLLDPSAVLRIRNTFHAEPVKRDQNGSGSPAIVNTDFCDTFYGGSPSGAATDVSVAFTLPDASTRTVDKATLATLGSIDPGESVSVPVGYTIPAPAAKGDAETDVQYLARLAALDGSILSTTATAQAATPSGPATATAGPVTTTLHLPILKLTKSGPDTVDAGTTAAYDLGLANTGTGPAAALAIDDTLPVGAHAVVTGVPTSLDPGESATAHASYAVLATQPAGDLTDTATLTWQDANGNGYGPVSATWTTTVHQANAASGLVLSPASAGPLPLGSSHTLTVTATNTAGEPVANLVVHLVVDGPNAAATNLTTGADGTATFTYTGTAAGTDTAQASAGALVSNTASVAWLTPAQPITTTTIHGRFFPNPSNSGAFTATPATPPSFEQDFPTIDFNPPSGTVRGASSSVNNRPFTDVATDLAGNFAGSIIAQGNGFQAGVGPLFDFDAVFTGTYTVAAAGNVSFDFFSDDGFIIGVGGGATRVSGSLQNPPASGVTPFEGYPVVGAYNNPTSPVANQVVVHFPGPGTYPYELDYTECCGGQLVITMTNHASGHGVPPTGSLTISPTTVASKPVGGSQALTVAAMDASGTPVSDLPVEFTITGPNQGGGSVLTDSAGLATFTYAGTASGTDQVQASSQISQQPAISNIVLVPWTGVALTPPTIGAAGPADGSTVTAPVPITASFTPPAGQTITSWSVSYVRGGTTTSVTLFSGSGTPPATLGTFDPTTLPNGSYTLTIRATASGGGTQSLAISLAVDGRLKLGRYQVTYQDLDVGVGGIPVQVLRSYDSFDKARGDFGIGWQLELANFRATTNGALGAGGWSQYNVQCGILCTTAWRSAKPHYATVVWPDGHQEVFDLTPSGGVNLFWFGTATFTGRAGATSTLAVNGDSSVSYLGDGNLYAGAIPSGSIFDPQQFRLTALDGTVYLLDRTRGLISATRPDGTAITVDSSGIHSSAGPSITFTRDTAGRISQVTDPAGESLHYGYDAAGNLASVTEPNGDIATYSYDADHNLLTTRDPSGHPLRTMTYDADGRLTGITDAAGNTTTVDLDVAARREVITSPDGLLTTVSTFDDAGNVLRVDDVFGGRTLTTSYTYDDLGRALTVTDPAGHVTRRMWNAAGHPLSITDPSGRRWQFVYDAHEHPTSVVGPDGTVLAALVYDTHGHLVRKTVADGGVTTYVYDGAGRLTSSTDPNLRSTGYAYNAAGLLNAVTMPDGRTWRYTYDGAGRIATTKDPSGATSQFTYDAAGDLTSYADALGHGGSFVNGFGFEGTNLVTSATDALGHTTTYAYDSSGRLATLTDRNGATTSFGYDAESRLTTMTLPGGATTTFGYDPLGELVEADNADLRLTFTYDDAGNLTGQTSRGTAASSQPTVTQALGHDASGLLTSITGPAGTSSLQYDANGFLTQLGNPAVGTFAFGRDPLGRLIGLGRPNGVTDVLTYDPAGDLLSRVSSTAGGPIDGLAYTYDENGRRSSLSDASGTTTYGYDQADRLTSADAPIGSLVPDEAFGYDAAGNRISGGSSFDAANRLLSDATTDYAYDNEGNLLSRTVRASGAVTHYTWNALHQLTSITLPGGATTSYRYDALNRRIEAAGPTGTIRSVNLGANVVAEYDGSNALLVSHLVIPSGTSLPGAAIASKTAGGGSSYPLRDGTGSVTGVTDGTGALTSQTAYSAFGVPYGTTPGRYAYGTYGWDAGTSLYDARARVYDPSLGRFLSEDPLPAANAYTYGSSSPTVFVDPSGQQAIVERAELDAEAETFAAEGEANVDVYFGVEREGGCYFGITSNFAARQAAHGDRFVVMEQVEVQLTRRQARVVETRLIQEFGGATHWNPATQLTNVINSVAEGGPLWSLVTQEVTSFADIGAILGSLAENPAFPCEPV